ncbi:MAG: hypothetical protein HRT90_00435 [Candidatus Margulisbacteria bacterium]|nr:hypothetical protein [Candidatus Margulisiibacteriota bacterium]
MSQKPVTIEDAKDTSKIDKKKILPHYRDGKSTVKVVPKKGKALDLCATWGEEYVCCNVHVLKSVQNCPYDCSYCFLQNYLNDGTMKVVGDIKALIDEVKEKTAKQPWRFFRIGTWELGDSLALEKQTGQARQLIQEFSKLPNALLELKTKSDQVDSILDIDHKGRTVVSWSVNPQTLIKRDEKGTASIKERLNAMQKVVASGYLVGLHFDPMILHDGWEENYWQLVRDIFEVVPLHQIAWISIGSLRFNPEMKKTMEINFPASDLTHQEMVLGSDGKIRYVKPIRVEMYEHLYRALTIFGDNDLLIYFCMERWDVWQKVLGYTPRSSGHLDFLFTQSLHDRFPGLVHLKPNLKLYE